jgi:hypothetical protein
MILDKRRITSDKWRIMCASVMAMLMESYKTELGFINFAQDGFEATHRKAQAQPFANLSLPIELLW